MKVKRKLLVIGRDFDAWAVRREDGTWSPWTCKSFEPEFVRVRFVEVKHMKRKAERQ